MFASAAFQANSDLQAIRRLLHRLPSPTVVDSDEHLQLPAVCAATRLWWRGEQLVAFAYVDHYDNLWFETESAATLAHLGDALVAWGEACLGRRVHVPGGLGRLDSPCWADDHARRALLVQNGFDEQPVRSLRYRRLLAEPVALGPLPAGFVARPVSPRDSVEQLVALHRVTFGAEHMTVAERLAIMRAPQYVPGLDMLAVAPGGELAAFCLGGLNGACGTADPVGTHPRYRRLGLAGALVSQVLAGLRRAGARWAELGTSSDNPPMQRLAERLAFECVAQKLWFSKAIR